MNSELKIAVGTDAFPPTTDGISNVAQNYASLINKEHGKAVIVTPKNPNQQDANYDYEIFRYKSWWFPSKEGYSFGWPFGDKLSYEIINRGFDVLHSHCPLATSYYFRLVNRKLRIPTVLTYHTKYEYDFDRRVPIKPARDFAYRFLLNNINAADEVWVTSAGTADSLRKIGYNGDFIVMPNGCDMKKTIIDPKTTAEIKASYGIPQNVPLFIYAGRMIWYKNIKIILDACKMMKNAGRDFRLIMLGFGADENKIKRYYQRLGIADKIINTGKMLNREKMQQHYATADLLIFPSTFDTNGLVVREAASCATPSLLVKDSCAAEGVTDGINGFLCEESAESIFGKLCEIANKRQLIETVGLGAQKDIYISWNEAVSRAYSRYQIVADDFYTKGKDKMPYRF